MKVKITCTILFFIFFFGNGVGLCSAEEKARKEVARKFRAGAYGLLVLPKLENFDVNGGGGVLAKYIFNENFALETAAEFSRWHFSSSSSQFTGTIEGVLNVIPWTLTAHWIMAESEKILLYLGGGLSVIFIANNATGTISPGGNATIDFDPAFGGHFTWGVDWFLNNHWALNGGVKFSLASSHTSETVQTGTLTATDANMNNISTRVGLSYFF